MATDPSARFPDMRGLLAALDRAASGTWTRKPLLIALACALFGLAWLGASTWRTQNNEQARTSQLPPNAIRPSPLPPLARSPEPDAPKANTTQLNASPQGSPVQAPDAGVTETPSAVPNATTADKVKAKANRERSRTKRAAAKKQGDVRYRDWLKDPFPK